MTLQRLIQWIIRLSNQMSKSKKMSYYCKKKRRKNKQGDKDKFFSDNFPLLLHAPLCCYLTENKQVVDVFKM